MFDSQLQTRLIHGGEPVDPHTKAIAPILVRSKTFQQEFGKPAEWQYSRSKNPTRSILESKLVAVEGEGLATVFGSGNAATAMFFLTFQPGDHIIFCDELYGGTLRLIRQLFSDWGLTYSFASFQSQDEVKALITPQTKYFFIETPTNPTLKIIDLSLMRALTQETGIPYIADMTFSPPCTTRAFDYGAESVLYSLSKYYAGHNDVLGGAIITKSKVLDERLRFMQRAVGAILSPDECYRVIQGAKTLQLRWTRASQNALTVARYLERHPAIKRIYYPGLETHPGHAIAKQQMAHGFGSVVSFEIHPADQQKLKRFVDALQLDGTIVYGESLASPETIVAYPSHMSHSSLSETERNALGITDGFFRLSLGLEDSDDIIRSFNRGLACLGHGNTVSRNKRTHNRQKLGAKLL